MELERTLKHPVRGEGVALHSGLRVRFSIEPAPAGTGFQFVRTDLWPHVVIPARVEHVVETRLATTLGRHGVRIGTVEHLLAALSGLRIDNARVLVDGAEVPVLDGSSAPFVAMIQAAGGTQAQSQPRRYLRVRRTVSVDDGVRSVRLEPASRFELQCSIDFDHPLIGDQRLNVSLSERSFVEQLAPARTFGFAGDIDAMRRAGLARGGSLQNAVVVDQSSVQNPEGLRFSDEFVRHKTLDAVGDLALLGMPILGRYVGIRAGHALNHTLMTELLRQRRAFEYVELTRVEGRTPSRVEEVEAAAPAFGWGGLAPA